MTNHENAPPGEEVGPGPRHHPRARDTDNTSYTAAHQSDRRSVDSSRCPDSDLVLDAEVIEPLDHGAAERLDRRIRLLVGTINDNIEKLHSLVQDAKAGQIHAVLGYPSWTAYVADVFNVQVRLERQQRRELVGYLSGEGMSQRAIADVMGVDQKTVSNDLHRAREENSSPESDPLIADDGEIADCLAMAELSDNEFESVLADARSEGDLSRDHVARLSHERRPAEPAPITGLDRKTYQPKPPTAEQKPRRGPITESFWKATYDLGKNTERLTRLVADDRFGRNGQALASQNLGDLRRARQRLDEIIADLDNWCDS